MKRYVFDTNVVSLLLRRDKNIIETMKTKLQPSDEIIGCPVVWFEVKRGLLAKDAAGQLKRFEQLFATFHWQDFNQEDWELASQLWVKRRNIGKPIEDADLLIGTYAHNRNAILITDNEKDFVDLGFAIENWKRI